MQDHQLAFLQLALGRNALRFGQFTLKSGRISPYFFTAGAFDDGAALATLGRCYADTIVSAGVGFDMLFGPAYKGIPLVTVTAASLADGHGRSLPWAFNRKEAKEHGEGGSIVGAPLSGHVLIIDDVMTAGTAIRESVDIIRKAGATPAGVVIALDRQERGQGPKSAVQEVEELFGLPVVSILKLADLISFLEATGNSAQLAAVRSYREQYGITSFP
jgi:orotate phosphoribosyltransferase